MQLCECCLRHSLDIMQPPFLTLHFGVVFTIMQHCKKGCWINCVKKSIQIVNHVWQPGISTANSYRKSCPYQIFVCLSLLEQFSINTYGMLIQHEYIYNIQLFKNPIHISLNSKWDVPPVGWGILPCSYQFSAEDSSCNSSYWAFPYVSRGSQLKCTEINSRLKL